MRGWIRSNTLRANRHWQSGGSKGITATFFPFYSPYEKYQSVSPLHFMHFNIGTVADTTTPQYTLVTFWETYGAFTARPKSPIVSYRTGQQKGIYDQYDSGVHRQSPTAMRYLRVHLHEVNRPEDLQGIKFISRGDMLKFTVQKGSVVTGQFKPARVRNVGTDIPWHSPLIQTGGGTTAEQFNTLQTGKHKLSEVYTPNSVYKALSDGITMYIDLGDYYDLVGVDGIDMAYAWDPVIDFDIRTNTRYSEDGATRYMQKLTQWVNEGVWQHKTELKQWQWRFNLQVVTEDEFTAGS